MLLRARLCVWRPSSRCSCCSCRHAASLSLCVRVSSTLHSKKESSLHAPARKVSSICCVVVSLLPALPGVRQPLIDCCFFLNILGDLKESDEEIGRIFAKDKGTSANDDVLDIKGRDIATRYPHKKHYVSSLNNFHALDNSLFKDLVLMYLEENFPKSAENLPTNGPLIESVLKYGREKGLEFMFWQPTRIENPSKTSNRWIIRGTDPPTESLRRKSWENALFRAVGPSTVLQTMLKGLKRAFKDKKRSLEDKSLRPLQAQHLDSRELDYARLEAHFEEEEDDSLPAALTKGLTGAQLRELQKANPDILMYPFFCSAAIRDVFDQKTQVTKLAEEYCNDQELDLKQIWELLKGEKKVKFYKPRVIDGMSVKKDMFDNMIFDDITEDGDSVCKALQNMSIGRLTRTSQRKKRKVEMEEPTTLLPPNSAMQVVSEGNILVSRAKKYRS